MPGELALLDLELVEVGELRPLLRRRRLGGEELPVAFALLVRLEEDLGAGLQCEIQITRIDNWLRQD